MKVYIRSNTSSIIVGSRLSTMRNQILKMFKACGVMDAVELKDKYQDGTLVFRFTAPNSKKVYEKRFVLDYESVPVDKKTSEYHTLSKGMYVDTSNNHVYDEFGNDLGDVYFRQSAVRHTTERNYNKDSLETSVGTVYMQEVGDLACFKQWVQKL